MNVSYIRRLAFIKYLFRIGEEQTKRPEPLSSTSLLTLQNAIELFLHLSSEYLNCSKKSNNFMDYFDVISKKINKELFHKVSMDKLNRARVNLKHYGNLPSKLDIDYFREITFEFLTQNCLLIFQKNFDEISLINLIPSEEVQNLLNEATKNLKINKYESLKNISIAFAKILLDYERKLVSKYGNYTTTEFSKDFLTYHHYYDIAGHTASFEIIEQRLNLIADSLLILSLGLDYNKYIKFKIISFYVYRTSGGECNVAPQTDIENNLGKSIEETYSIDDTNFCLDFVIESGLIIYSKDFNFSSLHLV